MVRLSHPRPPYVNTVMVFITLRGICLGDRQTAGRVSLLSVLLAVGCCGACAQSSHCVCKLLQYIN